MFEVRTSAPSIPRSLESQPLVGLTAELDARPFASQHDSDVAADSDYRTSPPPLTPPPSSCPPTAVIKSDNDSARSVVSPRLQSVTLRNRGREFTGSLGRELQRNRACRRCRGWLSARRRGLTPYYFNSHASAALANESWPDHTECRSYREATPINLSPPMSRVTSAHPETIDPTIPPSST
jgi:hypothetical protein